MTTISEELEQVARRLEARGDADSRIDAMRVRRAARQIAHLEDLVEGYKNLARQR